MQILHNARIYTLDAQRPLAKALAVRDGRIVAVADELTPLLALDETAETINLDGRVLIPGLTDAHIHLEHYALALQKVDCETGSLAECLQRVAARARSTPAGEWILGHGWNQNAWEGRFPTCADLDQVAPDRPVYLTAKSLHAAWTNSAALERAGIRSDMPDPPGGQIGRDVDGRPNGILFESAMQLVAEALPGPGVAKVAGAIEHALPSLWQLGITGVHDFDRSSCFAALQWLHAARRLKLRVVKSIPFEDLPHAAALGLRSGFGDDWLRLGTVKLFADGALGPRTAAVFQTYVGEPDQYGMLLLDAEEIIEHGRLAAENGFPLAIHAIGDRANHEALNALEQLKACTNASGLRHRIEHVQLLHPDDSTRLAALGVIASMQPIHATSDMEMADRYWGERAGLAYAWKTQCDAGTRLAFGSDAPVESPNPWWGLHAAVTRRRADGAPGPDGWRPEQRISPGDALAAFTSGAAYAAGVEDRLGKLATGYLADLLVLEIDPFTCHPDEIKDIRPRGTMIGGEWVWEEGIR
ncbi:MAG: amidohydrolase [Chloroflexota bacterium]